MADEQQLQKVVVASKSMAAAVILAILLGSLGLMPAGVVGGIVMLVFSILVGIFADDHAHQSKDTLVQEGVAEGSAKSTDISIVGALLGGLARQVAPDGATIIKARLSPLRLRMSAPAINKKICANKKICVRYFANYLVVSIFRRGAVN